MNHSHLPGFGAFLWIVVTCSVLSAVIPGADNPKGFTQRDMAKAMLEFNQRTLPDAYRQVGKRDPKWDDDALKFLDGMAQRYTAAGRGIFGDLPDPPADAQLKQWAAAAQAQGCDDPALKYAYATLLSDTGETEAARAMFLQAADGLYNSRYPVVRALYASSRQWTLNQANQAARDAGLKKFKDLYCAMVSSWQWKNIDRRIIYRQSLPMIEAMPLDQQKDLLDAVSAANGADPWMVDMLAGNYHISAGWKSRGTAAAGAVGEEQWAGFFQHLTKARDALGDAWKLHPDYPESAALMITVAMGAGDQLRENPSDWFQRATTAQIDYEQAYTNYRNALLPRWGGSAEELQAFAMDCLKTGRFDTNVPWQAVLTMQTLVNDVQQPQLWMDAEVSAALKKMCDGYVSASPPGKRREFFQTFKASAAFLATQYPDARQALEAAGYGIATDAFRSVGLMPQYAISEIYAFTNPDADSLVVGEQKAQMQQISDAIAAFQTSADRLANDHSSNARAAHFVKSRLQQFKWQKEFAAGQWIDVQPTDAEMNGWEPVSGVWTVQPDGTLVGKADLHGLLLTFTGTYLSPRFEIDGQFELPAQKGGATYFGMSLADSEPAKFSGWWMVRRDGKIDCYNNWSSQFHRELTVEHEQNTMDMTQWDDKVIGRFNGHMTTNMVGATQLMGPQMYLGLGSPGIPAGTEVHLSKLRVRKLSDQPQ